MRILMVTPYPPNRDGIAAYAVQSVRALRAAGHQVEVLSSGPSAAHHHLDLVGPRGALALARRVRGYDRVVVQFHPDFFYPPGASAWQRALEGLALTAAFRRARSVEVVLHEIDGRHGRRTTVHGRVTRRMWCSVDLVRVHTERDRQNFSRDFGVPRSKIEVIDHGADFVPRTHHDRVSARASLHVPPGAFVFLSIGFIQPHKGFDRAVHAFADLGVRHGRLDVVGSVRVEEPAYLAYRDELAALVQGTQGAYLHDGFVSDELFDRWIVASDVVVLPYRSIWSSGVLERARLFGRPVIATAVGGLPEQAAASGVVLVSDEGELRRAMRAAAGLRVDGAVGSRPWPGPGTYLRVRVQDEIVARAASERGYRRPAQRPDRGSGPGRRSGWRP
ncbi:MAG TPA: glycosyltransferase, partial [Mycobacteriales bacterium]